MAHQRIASGSSSSSLCKSKSSTTTLKVTSRFVCCVVLQLDRLFYQLFGCAGQQIRLRGKNLTESEHIKLHAYHTLELEVQRSFVLEKSVWESVDIARIKQACDHAASADLAAVLITVSGGRVY